MEQGLYIEKDTPLQRLDPRTKIIGMAVFFLLSVVITNIVSLAALLTLLLLLIVTSGSFSNLWRIKWLVIVISIMCVLFWLPSKSLVHGIVAALRLDVMFFAGILFVSGCRVDDFATGLTKLGVPYRIAFAVSLAFRLIPLLFATIQTTLEAQQSRGLDLRQGNILRRARNYIPLFIPVISLLVRDAHHLSMALESKGFGLSKRRTVCFDQEMGKGDYIALLLLLLVAVISVLVIR